MKQLGFVDVVSYNTLLKACDACAEGSRGGLYDVEMTFTGFHGDLPSGNLT